MALTNQWSTTVGRGSKADWQFTLTNTDGSPYAVAGYTWEYVVRPPKTASGSPPAVSVTTTAGSAGQITVASSPATVVTIALTADATAPLQPGTYDHALWSNVGTPDAFLWWEGALVVQAVPQP